jgi:CubicO group peptidase (beta-lactamase class C family)
MSRLLRVLVPCLLALHLGACAPLQRLPQSSPESVGLSQHSLANITRLMQRQVEDEKLAGAVALVARHGKVVYLQAVGQQDREAVLPMKADTIFRIASMTKPITSVASLMLYDDGLIQLDDPVSKYIPKFGQPKVLRPGQTEAVPAQREITIRHLLTHTSGLTYQWDAHLGPLYKAADITHGIVQENSSLEEKMKTLGRIPLLHDPGEAWTYGLSVDVLGRVVEVASGQSLQAFFAERIFKPLGMKDSTFFIPDDKRARLAVAYAPQAEAGLKRLDSELIVEGSFVYCADHPYQGKRCYFSGGGGLCSTVTDYWRFAQMLLNQGEFQGRRLLKPETVQLMTQDHVLSLKKDGGFGLGVSVKRKILSTYPEACIGTFGWGGFWYTTFFVDPARELIGICMGQLHPDGGASLNREFEGLVCEAVDY